MKKALGFIKNMFSWYLNRSWKTKLGMLLIAVVILGGLYWKYQSNQKENGYIMETVEYGTVKEVVSDTGVVHAGGQIQVYSPSRGIVTDVFVQNGDTVTKGQALFAVESSATDEEVQTAYAAYLTAVSTRNTARATEDTLRADMYTKWKTYRDLATNSTYENDDESPKDDERLNSAEFQSTRDLWEAAERKYAEQQTAIAAASADVAAKWRAYQATQNAEVSAPIAGAVANLTVVPGDSTDIETSASLAALGGTTTRSVLTLANFNTLEFHVPLGQSDIASVEPGQEASIELDAYKEASFSGRVLRVDSVGTNTGGVVKYMVYIGFDTPDPRFRAGMTGDAYITTKVLEHVLSVSNAAVKPYQGGRAVRVKEQGKKEPVYIPVQIGVRGEERTQILSGLSEGTQVISSLKNEQIERTGFFGF